MGLLSTVARVSGVRLPGIRFSVAARLEVLGEQFAGVPAGRGDTEPRGADVGDGVVAEHVLTEALGVHALHLQLRRDAEPQRQREPVLGGVDVGVDQAGHERRARGVDDVRPGGRLPADRGDAGAVQQDGGLRADALTVEHTGVGDGRDHAAPPFFAGLKAWCGPDVGLMRRTPHRVGQANATRNYMHVCTQLLFASFWGKVVA